MTSNEFAELITNLYDIEIIIQAKAYDHFRDSGVW